MSFAEFCGYYGSLAGLMILFDIYVMPRVLKKSENEARLRREVEIDNDPPVQEREPRS